LQGRESEAKKEVRGPQSAARRRELAAAGGQRLAVWALAVCGQRR
jgi:hypothetical protein